MEITSVTAPECLRLPEDGTNSASTMLRDARYRELGEALSIFRRNLHSLVIRRAFDAPYVPEAFTDALEWRDPPVTAIAAIRFLLNAVGQRLTAFADYGNGVPFHRIGPGGRTGLLAELAERPLAPHTDIPHGRLPPEPNHAMRPPSPELTLLACIRGDGVTSTFSCDVDKALSRLAKARAALLAEPFYTARTPSAWQRAASFERLPCIMTVGHQTFARLSPNLVTSNSLDHQRALDEIIEIAKLDAPTSTLTDGDILLLDNLKQFHGRGRVSIESNRERTLIRAYGTQTQQDSTGLALY